MAKTTERLSALKIAAVKETGYFADGGNLYFRVTPVGSRNWIFRYTIQGRTRDMGLGAFPEISLSSARRIAEKCRELVNEGIDPIDHRRSERASAQSAAARCLTFDDCVKEYIKDHEPAWRNAKHRAQWSATLASYASPVIGKVQVSEIDASLVLRALKAIWFEKPETASRVRGRIESILDWARVHGYRVGENPARWKGQLDHLLPSRSKIRRVQHHAALPYPEVGAFVAKLREHPGVTARALEFTILTAARSGEALMSTWREIDFEGSAWILAEDRMKAGKEHRVPLSRAAMRILKGQLDVRTDDFIFPGAKLGRPLSGMALLMLLRRMDRSDITVHGFRSTFRDWASECTNFPREVPEMALAHTISDAVEAAYRRGDLFEKRRRLMDAWSEFCSTDRSVAIVSPIRSRNS